MKLAPPVADALNDGARLGQDPAAFGDRVRMLHRLLSGTLPAEHALAGFPFGCSAERPELWILGVGPGSGELAAELGASFCFSQHHNLLNNKGSADPLASFEAFRRGGGRGGVLAIGGICAPSEEEARAARAEYSVELPMSFCGNPEQCANAIGDLAQRLGIDEVVILDHWPFMNRSPEQQVEDRARTLELLAGALL